MSTVHDPSLSGTAASGRARWASYGVTALVLLVLTLAAVVFLWDLALDVAGQLLAPPAGLLVQSAHATALEVGAPPLLALSALALLPPGRLLRQEGARRAEVAGALLLVVVAGLLALTDRALAAFYLTAVGVAQTLLLVAAAMTVLVLAAVRGRLRRSGAWFWDRARRLAALAALVCLLAWVATDLSRAWWLLVGALVTAAVLALVACATWLPRRLLVQAVREAGVEDLPPQERLQAQNDIRATLLQSVSGLVLIAGVVFTFWQVSAGQRAATAQFELSNQGQLAERFSRAVGQLSDTEDVPVRAGALYALRDVAEDSDVEDRQAVGAVMSAFIRDARPAGPEPRPAPPVVRADLEAALLGLTEEFAGTDLGPFGGENLRAVLADTDLRGVRLVEADLSLADLSRAVLTDVALSRADLDAATLVDADLRGADLAGADLSAADLTGADLRGATLEGAVLDGAYADTRTVWPRGFEPAAAGVRPSVCRDVDVGVGTEGSTVDVRGPPECR